MTKHIFIQDLTGRSELKQLKEEMYKKRGVDVYLQSEFEGQEGTSTLPDLLNDMDQIYLPVEYGNLEVIRVLTLARALKKTVTFFPEELTEEEQNLRELLEVGWSNDVEGLESIDFHRKKSIITEAKKPLKEFVIVSAVCLVVGVFAIAFLSEQEPPLIFKMLLLMNVALGIVGGFLAIESLN